MDCPRTRGCVNRRGAFAANDWQPLLWAAGENHLEIASKLLDLGEDINEQQPVTQISSKYAALHVAAQRGNAEMCKLLLERGADPSLRDKHNNTPLMLAEKKKNADCIQLLAAAGSTAVRSGGTPAAANLLA